MSDISFTFVEAICAGHSFGLINNKKSLIIGEGVNYANGADGTTKNLVFEYPERLIDVPISEAGFTGMAVGMATGGLNPIVHHGRVEFALLAMDQILTQAAKWEFMFGGNYPCRFAARINIGRQWGNGPQHTSSYNSLFYNTPGLDLLWPSRPREALIATKRLHHVDSPTISMEHRYLFRVSDKVKKSDFDNEKFDMPRCAVYGKDTKNIILTYGDGLVEALKVRERFKDMEPPTVICLTYFDQDRSLPEIVYELVSKSTSLVVIDTSNYHGGLMQAVSGRLAEKVVLADKMTVFSPPFTPCPTSPSLTKDYYPKSYKVAAYYAELYGNSKIDLTPYSFDEDHLPVEFDFSEIDCEYY
jgi:pyruvate/2-oxoglutarate/acetoin dehydrogenase E1 component